MVKTYKVLDLSDVHHKFCDRKAYNLAIQVGKEYGVDEVILNGDFADFYDVNSHGKNPLISDKLLDEVDYLISELSLLKTLFPKSKITYIEGNHENRLARYISNNCPEFFGIVNVQSLLMLEALKINFVPYTPNQCYRIGKLNFRHEPIGGGINSANSTVTKAGASVIYGHIHKIQESQLVTLDGHYLRAISVGCLCDKNLPAFQYVKNHHQWQLGFALITFYNDLWFCQNIHIIPSVNKYHCLANGVIYEI
jgi:predicted phosphodiesterase